MTYQQAEALLKDATPNGARARLARAIGQSESNKYALVIGQLEVPEARKDDPSIWAVLAILRGAVKMDASGNIVCVSDVRSIGQGRVSDPGNGHIGPAGTHQMGRWLWNTD